MDPEKLKHEISKIQFGTGLLKLEKRHDSSSDHQKPENIDPYTIFLGNIHPSTSIQSVKQKVQKAYRVDVGFAKKHKFGRYAFAKFRIAADAREAFALLNQMSNNNEGMDLVVRFRRVRGHIRMNGDDKSDLVTKPPTAIPLEVIDLTDDNNHENQTGIESEDHSTNEIERISRNLLQNDTLDWEGLRQMQIKRYETKGNFSKPVMIDFNTSKFMFSSGNCDTSQDVDGLDDLFYEINSGFCAISDDDLDFC